jgi:hypothetical protein
MEKKGKKRKGRIKGIDSIDFPVFYENEPAGK